MYLRRVEEVAKQIAVVKRNDSFKGVKKKKKIGHSSGTCECPQKMASSRRMRHPEPSIGPLLKFRPDWFRGDSSGRLRCLTDPGYGKMGVMERERERDFPVRGGIFEFLEAKRGLECSLPSDA
ncbi:hypothetical protein CEXT_199001 [Caerostris extrusa]|uniref:Uncharacterized protein n=1 Tax=Caerostris extrusa TaxID=172846 RepID=A0AAV4WT50_CAEEX|nr:hypothetical protein CEXT_199001 [Caerostris extrusa]